MRMPVRSMVGLLALALASGLVSAQHDGHGSGDNPHEGAISIRGDGTKAWMKVLGGSLGNQTIQGVDVGLFVLQAESPERLAAGAKGPTHLFNLTFVDAEESGRLEGVVGAIVIEGPEDRSHQVRFEPFADHYQAATRLEQEGEYRIRVAFADGKREGETKAFAFRYERKNDNAGHEGHGADHSGHDH